MGGTQAIEGVESLEIDVRISEGGSQLEGAWRADRQGRMRIDVSANRWSDWRTVAGVLRAFHEEQVDVSSSKVLQNTDVTRIEVNPAPSAGLFDAPRPR